MKDNKEEWEIPEIDLNIRHYSGHPSDVLKKVKHDIERHLKNPDVPQQTREIYSAIYNAINYYKAISYLPSAEFSTHDTFLSYSIQYFNEDYKYISSLYNELENDKEIVTLNARIKSPIGFFEKIKEKVNEYIKQNRDFKYFNESLRDLIGVRVIVDAPDCIKKQGPEAESNFLYEVFYNLMKYRGLENQDGATLKNGQYEFLPVNTRYDKTKLERLKQRPSQEGFDKKLITGENKIYIPSNRPEFMELPYIDSKVKDYNMWPKATGYQSLHVCVIPDFSYSMSQDEIPHYILPPSNFHYAIEYQFRTSEENHHAEHGIASHKLSYKPNETSEYHRLAVPFYICFDDPEISPSYNPNKEKELRLRNFGESYKKFYGHDFKDRFNISFKKFRDIFGFEDRNDVLVDRKKVCYDKDIDWYYLEDIPPFLFVSELESNYFRSLLEQNNPIATAYFLDSYRLSDGVIEISSYSDSDDISTKYKKPLPAETFRIQNSKSRDKDIDENSNEFNCSSNDKKGFEH